MSRERARAFQVQARCNGDTTSDVERVPLAADTPSGDETGGGPTSEASGAGTIGSTGTLPDGAGATALKGESTASASPKSKASHSSLPTRRVLEPTLAATRQPQCAGLGARERVSRDRENIATSSLLRSPRSPQTSQGDLAKVKRPPRREKSPPRRSLGRLRPAGQLATRWIGQARSSSGTARLHCSTRRARPTRRKRASSTTYLDDIVDEDDFGFLQTPPPLDIDGRSAASVATARTLHRSTNHRSCGPCRAAKQHCSAFDTGVRPCERCSLREASCCDETPPRTGPRKRACAGCNTTKCECVRNDESEACLRCRGVGMPCEPYARGGRDPVLEARREARRRDGTAEQQGVALRLVADGIAQHKADTSAQGATVVASAQLAVAEARARCATEAASARREAEEASARREAEASAQRAAEEESERREPAVEEAAQRAAQAQMKARREAAGMARLEAHGERERREAEEKAWRKAIETVEVQLKCARQEAAQQAQREAEERARREAAAEAMRKAVEQERAAALAAVAAVEQERAAALAAVAAVAARREAEEMAQCEAAEAARKAAAEVAEQERAVAAEVAAEATPREHARPPILLPGWRLAMHRPAEEEEDESFDVEVAAEAVSWACAETRTKQFEQMERNNESSLLAQMQNRRAEQKKKQREEKEAARAAKRAELAEQQSNLEAAASASSGEQGTRPRGSALVGCRVRVWWAGDGQSYSGVVKSYSSTRGHAVEYKDELKYHKLDYEAGDRTWEEWSLESARA